RLARQVSDSGWSESLTRQCLARLSNSSDSFSDESTPAALRARRAERLVLALDRLVSGLGRAPEFLVLNPLLYRLFDEPRSWPDCRPNEYAPGTCRQNLEHD